LPIRLINLPISS